MPTLLVSRVNVRKYYKLNLFLLSKVAEGYTQQLQSDLTTLLQLYEEIVDKISDFTFVAQEINTNKFECYT